MVFAGDANTSKLCMGPARLTACTSERSLALAVRAGPLPHRSWSGVPAVLCLGLLAAQTENRIESSRSTPRLVPSVSVVLSC